MKTIEQIKTDIDVLVRKQGNQGALKLGDVLDDIVDIVQTGFQEVNNTLDKFKAQITDVATFKAAVPNTATEIVFAFLGDVDLTGYTKSGSVGEGIVVYADGTKYAVVSAKIIYAPENSAEFFHNFSALTTLDLSNFDTTNTTDINGMFDGCAALTTLDVSKFNTKNVTNMNSMFYGCAALTTLDVSNFDTKNVTGMFNMFDGCAALTTLDVSNFDTKNITGMNSMFCGCAALTTLDVSNFDTKNVTNMDRMFYGCAALTTLDVSNFDTKNVTVMHRMFGGCAALTTLDVSNFDTKNVTVTVRMFLNCSSLTTIIANNWSADVNSDDMFSGCTSLVGGNGTTYNSSHVDATYAHIDVADNPGYFTAPA